MCKSSLFLVGKDSKMAIRTLDQEENGGHEIGVKITGLWKLRAAADESNGFS